MIALGEDHAKAYEESWMGQEAKILLEEEWMAADGTKWMVGHTREYMKAAVPFGAGESNEELTVTVKGYLEGHILQCEAQIQ